MKIDSITIEKTQIPFKVSFKHASAERLVSQSIIVTSQFKGLLGHGEGCPREYVTNESIESSIDFFKKHKKNILNIQNLDSLRAYLLEHKLDIDQNPSAWSAIEISLLDLFAQFESQSIEEYLGLDFYDQYKYTAVIGDYEFQTFKQIVDQHLKIGFQDFKIKLSGDLKKDQKKFDYLQKYKIKLRADANNYWQSSIEFIRYMRELNADIWAVEEPVQVNAYKELAHLCEELAISVILDESALRIEQLADLTVIPKPIINLRISKMGGLLRSIDFAAKAKELKIPVIVGAQVGETSILTRAALAITNTEVLAREGAYGTLLLEQDYFQPCLQFSTRGILSTKDIHKLGLGLRPLV